MGIYGEASLLFGQSDELLLADREHFRKEAKGEIDRRVLSALEAVLPEFLTQVTDKVEVAWVSLGMFLREMSGAGESWMDLQFGLTLRELWQQPSVRVRPLNEKSIVIVESGSLVWTGDRILEQVAFRCFPHRCVCEAGLQMSRETLPDVVDEKGWQRVLQRARRGGHFSRSSAPCPERFRALRVNDRMLPWIDRQFPDVRSRMIIPFTVAEHAIAIDALDRLVRWTHKHSSLGAKPTLKEIADAYIEWFREFDQLEPRALTSKQLDDAVSLLSRVGDEVL